MTVHIMKTRVLRTSKRDSEAACCWIKPILSVFFAILLIALIYYNSATSSSHLPVDDVISGCQNLNKETVWIKGFPKLMTESAFRLVDVNQDGILDILFGFATGMTSLIFNRYTCMLLRYVCTCTSTCVFVAQFMLERCYQTAAT